MDKKITRRIVLGTMIGGLVATPFVTRAVRRRKEGLNSNVELISNYFDRPLVPIMPDISKHEKPFAAVISLGPLLPSNRRFSKLVYESITDQELLLTDGDKILGKAKGEAQVQCVNREIEFENPNVSTEDIIVSKMTCTSFVRPHSKEVRNVFTIRYEQTVEGKTTVLAPLGLPQQELTPKYLLSEVSVGVSWSQFLSGDHVLNKDGKIEVTYEVLKTFERDGERFVRLGTDSMYRDYVPLISPKGVPEFDKRNNEVVLVRIVGRSDFSIDRALAEHESTVTVMLPEQVEEGNGKIVLCRGNSTLVSVS